MHDEIDPRAFLSLMGLARKRTEDTLRCARTFFPDSSDEELVQLASEMEETRNRQILAIVTKIPPLRKVTCWSKESSILECGHVTKVKLSQASRTTRCRVCLTEDNRNIVKSLREAGVTSNHEQSELHSGRDGRNSGASPAPSPQVVGLRDSP